MDRWHLYVVRTIDSFLYAGIATDVRRRFKEHLSQGRKASRYLLAHKPRELVFSMAVGDRGLALKVEYRFKRLSKGAKERIVQSGRMAFDRSSGRIEPIETHPRAGSRETLVISGDDMNAKTVYSTEHGRMCPECGRPASGCICADGKQAPKGSGTVRIGRETKGRKGKGVTVITGLPLDEDGLRALAKELKARCGTGGTVKGGVIEIQGDHRAALVDELKKKGYPAKLSGG